MGREILNFLEVWPILFKRGAYGSRRFQWHLSWQEGIGAKYEDTQGTVYTKISKFQFLAVLDFVSRAIVGTQAFVVRPSVIRKLRFLRNCCMGPGQILCAVPCPPYHQTIFFSFFKILIAIWDLPKLKILWRFEIFVNTGSYGAGNFKTLFRLGSLGALWKIFDVKIFKSLLLPQF